MKDQPNNKKYDNRKHFLLRTFRNFDKLFTLLDSQNCLTTHGNLATANSIYQNIEISF